MKLASFPIVRSIIASVGFACLAVACIAQSGDPTATSSQDLSVGHYYTCASTNACDDLDEGGGTECTAVSGCGWTLNADAGNWSCLQTTPCATGDLDTAEACTVNPFCKATEHFVVNGGGGGGGCTTWCGSVCC